MVYLQVLNVVLSTGHMYDESMLNYCSSISKSATYVLMNLTNHLDNYLDIHSCFYISGKLRHIKRFGG